MQSWRVGCSVQSWRVGCGVQSWRVGCGVQSWRVGCRSPIITRRSVEHGTRALTALG